MIDHEKIPATRDEIASMMRAHSAWITSSLNVPHTDWRPSVAVVCRDLEGGPDQTVMFALVVPFNTPDEKRTAMEGVGRYLFKEKCVPALAILSSEAWMATRQPGEEGKPPAECADRVEVIILTAIPFLSPKTPGKVEFVGFQKMPFGRDPAGVILPGPWHDPVIDERSESQILMHVWRGYLEAAREHMGNCFRNSGDAAGNSG
jgi:hypothetical protein